MSAIIRKEVIGGQTLLLGDCLEIMPSPANASRQLFGERDQHQHHHRDHPKGSSMTQQQATIRNMGAIREHHAISIPATPFTNGRPDPRPETAPPRGIISRRTAVTPAQVVEIIRRELVQWRAQA